MTDQGHHSEAPVFIIGNPRSGTTLFRLMLTCHPDIVIPPESGFLVTLYPRYKDFTGNDNELGEFANDLLSTDKMETWELPREGLVDHFQSKKPRNFAELVVCVYEYYAQVRQPGKRIWGEKTNFYLNHIPLLSEVFPNARFVHLVRDGRDVACSYRDLSTVTGKYSPQLPSNVVRAAMHWMKNLTTIHRSFDRLGWENVLEVRYEDLAADPINTLSSVCRFIGVDFSPQMLDFDRLNRESNLEPPSFNDWKGRTWTALTQSRSNRWQKEMSIEDIVLFQMEARDMLREYDYPLHPTRKDVILRTYWLSQKIADFLQRVTRASRKRLLGKSPRNSDAIGFR